MNGMVLDLFGITTVHDVWYLYSTVRIYIYILYILLKRGRKSDPTLTPESGSCADYLRARLDCFVVVM